ncbi:MAG: hypothetical protein CM1200mP10_31110 [Candidatus Neomarinimicrobiota bacterium]|nr:MAG: hypothetical protein CM1200mP10_31110 [Candidatus Neomarinimicrobiota bacterium]
MIGPAPLPEDAATTDEEPVEGSESNGESSEEPVEGSGSNGESSTQEQLDANHSVELPSP